MSSLKLSVSQIATLDQIFDGGYVIGNFKNRTLQSLEIRGLVRWYPYAKRENCEGIWKVTTEGRLIAQANLNAGLV